MPPSSLCERRQTKFSSKRKRRYWCVAKNFTQWLRSSPVQKECFIHPPWNSPLWNSRWFLDPIDITHSCNLTFVYRTNSWSNCISHHLWRVQWCLESYRVLNSKKVCIITTVWKWPTTFFLGQYSRLYRPLYHDQIVKSSEHNYSLSS